MTTIYIVSAGTYSAYHIVGICSTREKAETLRSAADADEIEEWPLDTLADMAAKGYCQWRVHMRKDGQVVACNQDAIREEEEYAVHRGPDGTMQIYCTALSQEHAVKIANERRAQMISNNEWE